VENLVVIKCHDEIMVKGFKFVSPGICSSSAYCCAGWDNRNMHFMQLIISI